jgi:hypothetical protein
MSKSEIKMFQTTKIKRKEEKKKRMQAAQRHPSPSEKERG